MSQMRMLTTQDNGESKALPPPPPDENQELARDMSTTTNLPSAEGDRQYAARKDSQSSQIKRREFNERTNDRTIDRSNDRTKARTNDRMNDRTNERTNGRLNERVAEVVRSLDTNNDLESQLEWAMGKLKETERKLDETVEALAFLHSTDTFRQGDDRIARARDELRHDIRIWSRNFHHHTSKKTVLKSLKDKLANGDEEPFRVVTAYWQQYLSDANEKGPSLLVQAYVWNELLKEVFDQLVWMGGPCRNMVEKCPTYKAFLELDEMVYSRHMEPAKRKEYYHWRAQSARVLGNSPKLHQDCIELRIASITKRLSSVLKPYSTKKDMFSDNANNNKANNLASIVRSAVALDLTFWQQKAVFDFDYPYPRLQEGKLPAFDPRGMTADLSVEQEDILKQGKALVHLVSAPALRKMGTSAGDNYDESVLLCKGVVDCLMTWNGTSK